MRALVYEGPGRPSRSTVGGADQAEYVRIPYADTSLYRLPDGAGEAALVMLSDILPTGFECGC